MPYACTRFFLIPMMLWSSLVVGADPKNGVLPPRVVESPITMGSVGQMLLSLLIVLAVIWAVAWLLKRSGRLSGVSKGRIKVLEVASLGTREKAVLLQAEDKKILVGVAPGQIKTLHVFDGAAETAETDTPVPSFDEQMILASKDEAS